MIVGYLLSILSRKKTVSKDLLILMQRHTTDETAFKELKTILPPSLSKKLPKLLQPHISSLLHCAKMPFNQLPKYISSLYIKEDLHKQFYWACIVLGHPDTSAAENITLGQKNLALSLEKLFITACTIGCVPILEELSLSYFDQIDAWAKTQNALAFRWIAREGYLSILKWFLKKKPSLFLEIFSEKHFDLFTYAAIRGHIAILDCFKENIPEPFFREALRHTLWKERDLPPDCRTTNDGSQNKKASFFYKAIKHAPLSFLEWLATYDRDALTACFTHNRYEAFNYAAERGEASLIYWMAEHTGLSISTLIEATHFQALHTAILDRRQEVIFLFFIEYPICFIHAVECALSKEPLWQEAINRFITLHISHLQSLQSFDRDLFDRQCRIMHTTNRPIYSQILKYLIQSKDPKISSLLEFFWNIPEIQKIAAQSTYSKDPKDSLLTVAIENNNIFAISKLLMMPSVRRSLLQRPYQPLHHQPATWPQLHYPESAMRSLTSDEETQYQAVLQYYHSQVIQKGGVTTLFDALKEELASHYHRSPAQCDSSTQKITLPLTWNDFQKMPLTPTEYELALHAYYQHPTHTAWRYLSIPNPWLSEKARFILTDDCNPYIRYANLPTSYQAWLVTCWLAATDPDSPPTQGYTLEGRYQYFIQTLACIGRAHNWDKDYDDNEGDKPSCSQGVKRHLLQSILGHALFDHCLTAETIQRELEDFVRSHFHTILTSKNSTRFRNAYITYGIENDQKSLMSLKMLDIPIATQNHFIQSLIHKYGKRFYGQPCFIKQIHQALSLSSDEDAHALRFASLLQPFFKKEMTFHTFSETYHAITQDQKECNAPLAREVVRKKKRLCSFP